MTWRYAGAPAERCANPTANIIGKANASAIGTLVERTTGYTMLLHLPNGYKPEQFAPVLAAKIKTLPKLLRGSLTWDQGVEMRDWKQVTVAADIAIFFCDPHSPPLTGQSGYYSSEQFASIA